MNRLVSFLFFVSAFLTINCHAQQLPDSLTQNLFEKKKSNYYLNNPVEFDNSNPQNLHYRIQIGSFTQKVDPDFFSNYYPITGITNGEYKRYYAGLFLHYNNAELARETLVNAGFKGAFLVAFYRAKEISLSRAIEMENLSITKAPGSKKTSPFRDISVVITELDTEHDKYLYTVDSSKLNDNRFYLDYFYYEFENATPLSEINTDAEEIMPIIWSNDSTMSFVRAFSPENTGGLKSGHDIWFGKGADTNYQTVGSFKKINTKYNDAIVGVNKKGNTVYLLNHYDGDGIKRGLSSISLRSGQWSEPNPLAIPTLAFANNFYGMYVHPDEDLILLSMEGKDSFGMNDIYIIEKDSLGNWGELIHLDSTINTDGNDISPFITKDKRIFIYSTDGMGGLGGNDLIVFKRNDDTWTNWSEPQNAGIYVNTSGFEAYPFMVNNDFYYASTRDSSLSDIYHADVVSNMFLPIEEYLELEDSLLFTYNVEAGILKNASEEELEFENIPVLAMVNTDSRIDMIFFDFDRYNLKPSFVRFLNELKNVLLKNPDISLDLRGHTDSIGTLAYNYVLGENRAQSVKDYLISIGVKPSRLSASSLGKEIPIASNETAYGRAQNRRVEIRFIRKEEN